MRKNDSSRITKIAKKIKEARNLKVFSAIDVIIAEASSFEPFQIDDISIKYPRQTELLAESIQNDICDFVVVDLPLKGSHFNFELLSNPTIYCITKHDINIVARQPWLPENFRFEDTLYDEIEFLFAVDDITAKDIDFVFDSTDSNFIADIEIDISNNIIISDNLLKSIFSSGIKVSGKNYADKYWQEVKITFNETIGSKRNYSIRTQEYSKHSKQPLDTTPQNSRLINKFIPQTNSIWDIIYVILLPPLNIEPTARSLSIPHQLYPYQFTGVEFLMKNKHALLADDMGTGKTVMTLVALRILFRKGTVRHALILCPKSVLYEWEHHLREWAPDLSYFVVTGTQPVRSLAWDHLFHVYLTTYDIFASDMESYQTMLANKFDIVIVDEAHNIKNPQTRRYRSIKKLKANIRWALTGTPIQNRIEDLYAIFDFIYPNYLSTYDRNLQMYSYDQKLLKDKISPYFLRRRKVDVLSDLPPKQYQEYWLELDDEQKKEYFAVEGKIRDEIINTDPNSPLFRGIFRNKLMKLKQICNFASRKISSPKTDLLFEQIEEIIGGDNKVIVFSQFVDEGVDKIVNFLDKNFKVALLKGDQSDSERRKQIELFKRNKDVSVLVASVRVGGVGLNLTQASYVIHFDHWWNPAVMWQAEDRVHRRGQTKGVNVYSYWISNTVDERIYSILKQKKLLISNIVEGLSEEVIDQVLTTKDMLEILGIETQVEIKQKDFRVTGQDYPLSIMEVLSKLQSVSPSEFERIVSNLMKYMGFPIVNITGKSSDGGVDIVCKRNNKGETEEVAVQCKRYQGKVGIKIAREFLGAIHDYSFDYGYLITTGEFTQDCLAFCQRSGKVKTISGVELSKHLIQFGLFDSMMNS